MNGKLSIATSLATTITAVALALAAAAESAPKPGFAPGVWIGSGTMSGTRVDGPMTTRLSGAVRFRFTVKPTLAASGTGVMTTTIKGGGPVSSILRSVATLSVSGTGSDARVAGTQKVSGTVSDGTISRDIGFSKAFAGRLVIARAGSCKVTGTLPMGDGFKFTWTATKGSGICL
jgi:hypothetical protein